MRSILIAFNFSIFAAALYLLLWPVISNFFYARAERIRKRMATAATELRLAEKNLDEAKDKIGRLSQEIDERKRIADAGARAEQKMLLEEATRQADYILSSAKEAALGELPRTKAQLKSELIDEAFRLAQEELIRDLGNTAIASQVMERAAGKIYDKANAVEWR